MIIPAPNIEIRPWMYKLSKVTKPANVLYTANLYALPADCECYNTVDCSHKYCVYRAALQYVLPVIAMYGMA
jgi:hypothetical protein